MNAIDVLAGVWAAVVMGAVMPGCLWPYETVRNFAAVAGAWCVLGMSMLYLPLAMSLWQVAAIVLVAWWVIRSSTAPRPDLAMRVAWRIGLGLAAAILCGYRLGTWCVAAPVLVACAVTAYGIGRRCFGWSWFKESWGAGKKISGKMVGIQGNSNYFGMSQMVAVFAALHLCAHSSLWWVTAVAVLLVGLVCSGCRAAWAGTSAGVCVWFPAVGSWFVIGAVSLGIVWWFHPMSKVDGCRVSAQLRMQIWRSIWNLLRANPVRLLAGLGHDNLKLSMPLILSQLKTQRRVPLFSRARHAHNDFVQMAADSGLIGLIGWLALCAAAMWFGWDRYPAIAGGLAAFLVAGCGLHLLYLPAVQVMACLFVGLLLPPAADTAVSVAPWWLVAVWVAVGCAALSREWLWVKFARGLVQALSPGSKRTIADVMAIQPTSTLGNVMMGRLALIQQKLFWADLFATQAHVLYDGEARMEEVLGLRAEVAAACGSGEIAAHYAAQAARFSGTAPGDGGK